MRSYWLVCLFLVIFLALVLFIGYRPTPVNAPPFEISVSYLESLIATIGPEAAYQEFAESITHLSPHDQHTAAHEFGTALYNTTSLAGLPICDDRFSNGCFHSFSGSAIAAGGLENTVELMVDVCNKETTVALTHSCLHGVGHGMQAYLGYTYDDLLKGIDTCREKTTGNLTAGCWGGIFMEYNLQSLLETQLVRPLTEANRFTPCDSLPAELRPSCIFWQPEWWEEVYLDSLSAADFFAKAGRYCSDLPRGAERQSCFSGIGSIMPDRVPDIVEESEICTSIAPTLEDTMACWSFVYAKTPYIERTELAVENLCNKFSGEEKRYCIQYEDTPADIFNEHGRAIFP